MQYIYEYFIFFIIALLVSFSCTPLAKQLAFKIGAVDIPKDDRRMHKKPIARLGGIAIVAGFLVSFLSNFLFSYYSLSDMLKIAHQPLGLLAGIIIIVTVGIFDDIKPLPAKLKLVFQILAALVVVMTGSRILFVTNPFPGPALFELVPWVSYILSIAWIVGITNAINLIDGLDGLAAGVSSISSLALFIVSVIRPDGSDMYTAIITAILAGATLGFLPYNFNPAKIFMGDTGATFLGFTLATISIQGTLKSYTAISIAIPLLVLGLPLFDTIFAIIRRIISGKSIMEADRGHLHHKLMDMGLSHKQSVVAMYVVSAALGLCAIVLADKGVLSAIILVIAFLIFVIAGARYMSELDSGETEDEAEVLEATEVKEETKINKKDIIVKEPKDMKQQP